MKNQALKDAAQCAIKFVENYSGTGAKTKRYQALRALAELTLTDLENGKPNGPCEYTAYDVLEKIKGKYSKEETDKRSINRYLKELEEQLPSHEEMLKDIAAENQLTAIPSYYFSASPGGGSGNYSKHFIIPVELKETEFSAVSEVVPEGAIKYYLESIENLPSWIKWINNFELSEWRITFIAGLMSLALILGLGLYFLFMSVFLYSHSGGLEILRSFFGTSILIFIIFWPFRLLYFCLTNRIIAAPILLQPSNMTNAQIECLATNTIRESTGKPIRKLRIVSYASTCPLCKSRIEVEKGGKEFHHRLIGRCLESPQEHVYSFDRVLRIGWAMRIH
ncbi:MAG: hypothetical protein PHY16_18650 [Methylobacter sp.]|nr:hypothetical protein [Methylobacter sp.]